MFNKNNGHVPQRPTKTGPSKQTRDTYIRKVKEITKRPAPPPPKKTGGS